MEFETNKPVSADDIAHADAPRITLQPLHMDIAPEAVDGPSGGTQADAVFDFEAESTGATALSSSKLTDHPHHGTALVFAALIAFMFGGTLVTLYMIR